MAGFSWPWQYQFPPFFSIQPNADTRRKQQEAWCSLILGYCKYQKIHQLDIAEAATGELFNNKSIERKLSTQQIVDLLNVLAAQGHVEWQDPRKKSCLVMWRTPEEWGKLIHDWAIAFGHANTVCTFYEITSGDDTVGKGVPPMSAILRYPSTLLHGWTEEIQRGPHFVECVVRLAAIKFHGIENWLLVKALKTLEAQRKAEIIPMGEGNDGVKFFA